MIKTAIRVKRWTRRNEFGGFQQLLKEWRVFGVKVWTKEIDREDVPGWAEIQLATLGYTEWRSKFAEYIR
jgi:hypothetical protein